MNGRGFRQAAVIVLAALALLALPSGVFGAATHFEFLTPTSVTPGSQFQFTVTANNSNGSIDTGYSGTVTFSSSDPNAILPGSTMLTSGSGTFNATMNTPGCRRITASDGTRISTSNVIAVNGCEVIDSQSNGLSGGDPTQTGRIAQSPPATQCNTTTTPTLADPTGARAYDSYTHTNMTNGPMCMTVDISPDLTCDEGKIFNVAYLGGFNPANPVQNYLADSGSPAQVAGQVATTSYTVPAGATFVDVVHATDAAFTCTQYFYTLSANKPFAFSLPTATGDPRVGQVLGWDTGTWSDNSNFTYQWRRCDQAGTGCADIPGATSGTYAPGSSDVGSTLRIRVFATSALGTSSADSPPTAAVTTPITQVTVTGQRAAALKKCAKIKNAQKRKKCKRRARRLPV